MKKIINKIMLLGLFKKLLKVKKKLQARGLILLLLVLFFTIINLSKVITPSISGLHYVFVRLIRYPNFSYEDKMKEKVGNEYYDWTEFVKNHTSINSYIMHPPQMWPWPQSGNPEFSQYFLYPAKLIRENRFNLLEQGNQTSHVLIAWGESLSDETLNGWPKFPIIFQKIFYLPQRRKIEVKGITGLTEWEHNSERIINNFDGNTWDITYTSSDYDYWIKQTDQILLPNFSYKLQVKSNWINSTALIARVNYSDTDSAVFLSSPNNKTDEWQTLQIEDLYSRALRFGQRQGWVTKKMRVTGLGLDTGHPAKMPYLEKWGLLEMEKGGEERKNYLKKYVSKNSRSLSSLGGISYLEKNINEAIFYYEQVSVLEPSDSLNYYWLADAYRKLGNKRSAEENYKKALELAPEIPWYHFALGEYYQSENQLEKAKAEYEAAIEIDRESLWAHYWLGKVYETQEERALAYRHFVLASNGPRSAFSSDGKLAEKEAKKIKDEESKQILDALKKIKTNPKDLDARRQLGRSYIIINEIKKAKEQFRIVYQLYTQEKDKLKKTEAGLPPVITDYLKTPIFGFLSQGVQSHTINDKSAVVLNNYTSFITYPKEFFPIDNGTVEIFWKPPEEIKTDGIINIIYQPKGLRVWLERQKVNFSIYSEDEKHWQKISSESLSWDSNKWYEITISYGDSGMTLTLNKRKLVNNNFPGGISHSHDIYLGRGPIGKVSKEFLLEGYFYMIKVYDYQRTGEN